MDQDLSLLAELLVAFFLVVGGFFALVGSIGLIRLKDTMQRLHAPTKATTVGVGGALISSMLYFLLIENQLSFHELLITLFLFLTAPITANFIAKTYMQDKIRRKDLPESGREYGWALYDHPPEMTDESK
ncbi:Na+/H+ antiporter subunit G [Salipiger bermudensis]|uniref:pH adaption potassium efflux system protein PhaG n=1 Tax=Salipiger bermudensis (strain DSM 26914 / JCM 13377 / KCTC 12554 / HTCC2601) TaxID=314265 RepID=Q0FM31_SALBH|nr:Na+/H+ antiporter subunit G [Salipiger bermudensis]EAU45294.1 pH adaption potassium efflux system protein PhaG [Salipiger bermudensis HTCC2601]MBN9678293.1 Na+/H+ antiporter subunit G [Salipiger bermudensis]MCA1288192.1 Na+/H+ antiporter subunit G [Salipiger bermudensis]